jgi:hypothetical protein
MQNVLPTFKTFQLDKDAKKRKDKSRQWDPSSSLPRIHKTPTFLKEDFEPKLKASPVTSYHISDSAAPNKRYLESSFPHDDRPEKSPLCDSERFVLDMLICIISLTISPCMTMNPCPPCFLS